DDELDPGSRLPERRAQRLEAGDLRRPARRDDKALDEQLVRADRSRQPAEIAGERGGIVAKEFAERAVKVEMDRRAIIPVADLADAADDAFGVGDELFALESDVALDLLK